MYMSVYIYIYIHMFIYAYVNIYIYIYIHTYLQTVRQISPRGDHRLPARRVHRVGPAAALGAAGAVFGGAIYDNY